MLSNRDDYKEWQDRYADLEEEFDEDWSDEKKRDHFENMKLHNDQELQEREEVREEWGDDGNEGHDQRIEKLRDRSLLLGHAIAHAEGTYEYQTDRMQDMDEDLRRDLERENNERYGHDEYQGNDGGNEQGETSDMEIESDSDED